MDVKAVDQKHKRVKSNKHKRKKRAPSKVGKQHKSKGTHHKKGRKPSKSRSKSKKKSGFLCCRKKQKKRRKSKSKTTKKQPKSKPIKQLAPLPNEHLGGVVLVKNGKTPTGGTPAAQTPITPQKQEKASSEPLTPEKDGVKAPKTPQSGEEVKLSKKKIGSDKDGDKEEKVENNKMGENEKDDEAHSDAKEEVEKAGEKRKKKNTENMNLDKLLDEVDKAENKISILKPFAEKVVSPDSTVAANHFSQVSCYIPPHVTKRHFVANMSKNRFADVICLDHSRVKLADSSYIHANWFDVNSQKRTILTQFPLPHTASDFWQMVIEQKVKCVLLIMTDQEYKHFGGNLIFSQNQDFLSFEDRSIRVGEFKEIELGKGWVLKVISVTNGSYKSFVHIHHYKNWLHDSAPSDSKQIWQVQSYLQKYTDPHVYMSLSGCGRAGTWALFETVNAGLHCEQPTFNMIKSLENLRHGRLHSVQNLAQFSFVYTMIADKILGKAPPTESSKDQESSTVAALRQLTIQ
ncbi:hypothetical protein L5515_012081 [Caenorhabditis briggsae]|uniref:Tyrosine-protein phosphatase domain-containing protein n=1 Tax=Caenorhabditis briggsae TaxID=6238 RepID=A0AAE9JGJ9_CAEBR|nr:hypothetical protein L5515_012081 [Caenorhabditis briggsae]